MKLLILFLLDMLNNRDSETDPEANYYDHDKKNIHPAL